MVQRDGGENAAPACAPRGGLASRSIRNFIEPLRFEKISEIIKSNCKIIQTNCKIIKSNCKIIKSNHKIIKSNILERPSWSHPNQENGWWGPP